LQRFRRSFRTFPVGKIAEQPFGDGEVGDISRVFFEFFNSFESGGANFRRRFFINLRFDNLRWREFPKSLKFDRNCPSR
jgi:hypothetical protein